MQGGGGGGGRVGGEEEGESLQKIEEHPFASKIGTGEEPCAKADAEEMS